MKKPSDSSNADYDIGDLLGLGSQSVRKNYYPALQAADAACLRGETERSVAQYRVKFSGDRWRWMRSDAVVVERDRAGAPLRMVGTQADITDAFRKAETNARSSATGITDAFRKAGNDSGDSFKSSLSGMVSAAGDSGGQAGLGFIDGFAPRIASLGSKAGPIGAALAGTAALGLAAGTLLADNVIKATEAFEAILNRHARAVEAARIISEGLVRTLAAEIRSQRGVPNAYGATGQATPTDGSAVAFSRSA